MYSGVLDKAQKDHPKEYGSWKQAKDTLVKAYNDYKSEFVKYSNKNAVGPPPGSKLEDQFFKGVQTELQRLDTLFAAMDLGMYDGNNANGCFNQRDYDEIVLRPSFGWNFGFFMAKTGGVEINFDSKAGKAQKSIIAIVTWGNLTTEEGAPKDQVIPGISKEELAKGESIFDAKYNLPKNVPQGCYEFVVAYASKNNPVGHDLFRAAAYYDSETHGPNARRNILLKSDTNTYTERRLAIDMTFRKFDTLATVQANKQLSEATIPAIQLGLMFFAVHKPAEDGKPGRYFLAAGQRFRGGGTSLQGFYDVCNAFDTNKPAVWRGRQGYGQRPLSATQTAWVRKMIKSSFQEAAGKNWSLREANFVNKGLGVRESTMGVFALHESYGAAIKEAGFGVLEYSEFEKFNRLDSINAASDKNEPRPLPWKDATLGAKLSVQGLPGGSIRNTSIAGFKNFGEDKDWSAGENYKSYFQRMAVELALSYANDVGPAQDKNYSWNGTKYEMIETNQAVYDKYALIVANVIAPEYLQIYQQVLAIETWARLIADEDKNLPMSSKEYKVNTPNASVGRNALSGAKAKNKTDFIDPVKKGSKGAAGKEPPEKEDPIETEKKEKFVKQCALMLNMTELKEVYKKNVVSNKISPTSIHSGVPFGGRLAMLGCLNPKRISEIQNYCVMPTKKVLDPMLNMTPAMASALIPKIRLHKVWSEGTLQKEVTFPWPTFEKRNYPRSLKKDPDIDRGGGYGIQEFNWSFEGTQPGTARNDIKAELTLYFQNFREFFKERKTGSLKWSYVDLVLFPGAGHKRKMKKGEQPKKTGFGSSHKRKNDPSYYRVRVDCGWHVPDKASFSKILPKNIKFHKFKRALEMTNKSFYLNMVDHDIDIRTDGTVQIKIEYRAYIESAMKKPEYDALTSPQVMMQRMQFAKEYERLKSQCSPEQLAELEKTYDGLENAFAEASYQSIVKRLIDRERLFYGFVDKAAVDSVLASGRLTRHPTFKFGGQSTGEGSQDSQAKGGTTKPTVTWDESATSYKDFVPPEMGDHNTMCTFFYLGDLFHTCMDGMYSANFPVDPFVGPGSASEKIAPTRPKDGKQEMVIMLSDFEYQISPKLGSQGEASPPQFGTMNIAEVPISLEYFFEWFQKKVIDVKRRSYPIAYFIRDLLNELMGSVFAQACWSKKIDKRVSFQTSNFMIVKDKEYGVLGNIAPTTAMGEENYKVAADVRYDAGMIPWRSSKENASVNDFANVVLVYPMRQNDYNEGLGNGQIDGMRGCHHYTIGSPKGLLKSVKFSKSDNAYLKEARFMNHGNQGLMQLGNVYKVDLDMIGNTLYYPGMYLFLDPRGIGGLEWDPTKGPNGGKPSAANALGFGGYHVVIGVKSSISTSGFSTSVEAQFDYSGDGSESSKKIQEDNATIEEASTEFRKNCEEAIKARQADLATVDKLIKEGQAGVGDVLDSLQTAEGMLTQIQGVKLSTRPIVTDYSEAEPGEWSTPMNNLQNKFVPLGDDAPPPPSTYNYGQIPGVTDTQPTTVPPEDTAPAKPIPANPSPEADTTPTPSTPTPTPAVEESPTQSSAASDPNTRVEVIGMSRQEGEDLLAEMGGSLASRRGSGRGGR
jgi:hypothetical protein